MARLSVSASSPGAICWELTSVWAAAIALSRSHWDATKNISWTTVKKHAMNSGRASAASTTTLALYA